jgi:hypothetical protein
MRSYNERNPGRWRRHANPRKAQLRSVAQSEAVRLRAAEAQALTAGRAIVAGRFRPAEDAVVMREDLPLVERALQLRRTYHSVIGRRSYLLRHGVGGKPRAIGMRRSGGTSRFIGVSRHQGRWRVQLSVLNEAEGRYRSKFIASFDDELEAAHAYDRVAYAMYGQFALLNFERLP